MSVPSLTTYEGLVAFLENPTNRANLASAMKIQFALFYYVMYLLIRKQPLKEPSHILLACDYLQKVADGKGNHLAINMPPGYGKTSLVIYWLAWCYSRNPELHFLYTNSVYSSVKQRGAEVMGILNNHWSRKFFNISMAREARSNTLFRLKGASARSGYIGVALEGGITGLDAGNPVAPLPTLSKMEIVDQEPFNLYSEEAMSAGNDASLMPFSGGFIADDLLNASFIRSDTQKERIRDIWINTLWSRLRGLNSRSILIGQRLCHDDIFSFIKELEKSGQKWDWCIVKGLDEDDKSTWESAISTEALLGMRNFHTTKEKYWAQYQQSPIIPSGEIIKQEWFKYHNNNLWEWHMLDMFITADTAVGKNDSGDWTVFSVWASTTQGLCLLDLVRGKWGFEQQFQQALLLWDKWRCKRDANGKEVGWTKYGRGDKLSSFYIEETNHGSFLMQTLRSISIERGLNMAVGELKADKDRVLRVQETTPFIEAGFVFLPDNRPEITTDFLDELIKFTHTDEHKHDDQVDCLVYAIQKGIMCYPAIFKLPYGGFWDK